MILSIDSWRMQFAWHLSMLIIAIPLSLVCPTVLRKYDLRKYVNTFKARSQTPVNEHNSTRGRCYCGMRYVLFLLQLIWSRIFFLTGDMANLYSFSQGSLEWLCIELFFSDLSLWNQYKYIPFDSFSCRILIIFNKKSIITGISNEARSELIIYPILCPNVIILTTRTSFFISSAIKTEIVQEFKVKLLQ